MEKKFVINEEKHILVLDALLGDADLMVAVNASESFEEGYKLVAEKVPDLSLEEFTASMDLLKEMLLSRMDDTPVQ